MNLLFLQRQGTDLYDTLLSSETSRGILRFYRPKRLDFGVEVTSASLGSALSLVSELRWYVRRYVDRVLLECIPGTYCTLALAQDIYEREQELSAPWKFRQLIGIKDGAVAGIRDPSGTDDIDVNAFRCEMDAVLEVWCCEEECECWI